MRRGVLVAIGWLAALAGSAIAADEGADPEWLPRAARFLPEGYVLGQVVATAPDGTSASIAVYPAHANDPDVPASVFDPGEALVVKLRDTGNGPEPISGEIVEREPVQVIEDPLDHSEGGYAYLEREIWRHGQESYPSGTEACDFYAWSIDENPAGLNVYLKASPDSRLLGSLPPRYKFAGASEAAPEEGFLTEFHVIGWRDGWFLIEHAEPPGRAYVPPDDYPDDHPEPFAGRGWIPASRIGGNYANGDTPTRAHDADGAPIEGLYQAPHIDAQWTPILGDPGGAGPKRILACSGLWVLVESVDGVIGWWRRICSNQVTVCS